MQIEIRHYFSLNHLAAASVMARMCSEIEEEPQSQVNWPSSNFKNQACAVSALISSVAFLEATINEIFSDCAERTSAHNREFPNAELLSELWRRGIPRTASYTVLEKYQIALILAGKEQLPTDSNPVQDVDAMVHARNFLIHFEPEFVRSTSENERVKLQKIQSRLQGKFELNKLAPSNCLFFPDRALGAGCAAWAVRTAIALTDRFFSVAGLPATYNHLRLEAPYSYFQTSSN